jgi:hypothetical protein
MNSQTEERLRAAYAAKADQVTPERLDQLAARRLIEDGVGWKSDGSAFEISAETDLEDDVTPLVADRGTGASRHARWVAPLLAAAAVIALAVGVTVISTTKHDGTPRPGNSTGPALLGSNQQADRSAIPWSQVDAGWTIALWTPATLTGEQEFTKVRPQTVFLVNPVGGRYLITTLNGNYTLQLADWSTDVRTALLIRQGDKSSAVIQLDLATGKTQSFNAAGKVRLAQFTMRGAAILLERAEKAIERVSPEGEHQLTYPFSGVTNSFTSHYPLSQTDGGTIVLEAKRGLVVRDEDGSLRRAIAPPAGMGTCWPVRWWDADSILAACEPELLTARVQPLYIVPIWVPGPATPLSTPPSIDITFTLAWRLYTGVLLLNNTSCEEAAVLGDLDSTRHITVHALPTGLGGYALNPVGATVSTVAFLVQLRCGQTPALVSFTPGTDQVTRLLGTGVNGGSVLDALGFGSTS